MLQNRISEYEKLINLPVGRQDQIKIQRLRKEIDLESSVQEKDENLFFLKTGIDNFLMYDRVVKTCFRMYLDLGKTRYFCYSINLRNLKDRYSGKRNGNIFLTLFSVNENRGSDIYWQTSMKFVYPVECRKNRLKKMDISPVIKSITDKGFRIRTGPSDRKFKLECFIQKKSRFGNKIILDLKQDTSRSTVYKIQKRLGKKSSLKQYRGRFSIIFESDSNLSES